ncbi:hypothetical protein DFJ74DRAFT_767362 [Hyaloraphidium curvatum]|nr:hypothetical protein DFJ74DRAFT_767362 [Hyaloraphidium curvatum]
MDPERAEDGLPEKPSGPRPLRAPLLTAAELLALFPFPPSDRGSADPAAEARAADPVDGRALLAGLDDGLLRVLSAPQAHWPLPRSLGWALGVVQFAAILALYLAASALLNDGYFGAAQLWAAVGVGAVVFIAEAVRMARVYWDVRAAERAKDLGAIQPYSPAVNPLCTFVRRNQLLGSQRTSPLVAHRDEDGPLCTCPRKGCSGASAKAAGRAKLVLMPLYTAAFSFLTTVMPNWTLLVTWAPRIWGHGWSAVLMALALACDVYYNFLANLFLLYDFLGPQNWNAEVLRRLHRRALVLALDALQAKAESAVESANQGKPPELDHGKQEDYVWLHERFAEGWNAAAHTNWFTNLALPLIVYGSLAAAVNMIVGSCVPGPALSTALMSLLLFAVVLNNAAASNRRIFDARGLYLSARQRLRFLAAECTPATPSDPRWQTGGWLRAHCDALSGCLAQAEAGGARLLGFQVGQGTVRTSVVTIVTLAVGMWSVLRGLGITATMEFACPRR